MELTVTSAKYALVLLSIGGAAAGLNLGVMELTDSPSSQAAEEVLLSSGSDPVAQDPLQVVVDVPVVVPDSVAATTLVELAPEATAAPAKASFSASQEAAATTALTSVKAAATSSTVGPATKAQAATGSAAPHATQAPAPAATEYKYYDFPGVASQIVVARHGDGSLEFWSVTTESGWSYRVEKDTSRMVEVEFSQEPNGEGEAEWSLEYEDGDLKVKKEISLEDDEDDEDDRHDEYDDEREDDHEEEDDD